MLLKHKTAFVFVVVMLCFAVFLTSLQFRTCDCSPRFSWGFVVVFRDAINFNKSISWGLGIGRLI